MRLSVTARLALLAILVSLASSFVLIAVIRQQVASDALSALRRDTAEQAETYRALVNGGGPGAARRTVATIADTGDPSEIAALYDRAGRRLSGAGPDRLAFPPRAIAFNRIEVIGVGGRWDDVEAAFAIQPAGNAWLVTGRLLGDRERGERAIERALLLALVLSSVLGVAGGLIVTRYVTARLGRIADTADRVAAGDMTRRVALSGSGDAFERLGSRVNLMLDRVERLMGELRLVTDSLGHDLRSPLARVRGRIESALAHDAPAAREAALAGALAETDAVLLMLSTLLEIGRSEATPRERLTRTDPAELLAEIGEFYAPVVEEAERPFAVEIGAAVPPLPLHRELLTQAVGNLIDNALKHAAGAITVGLDGGEGALTIWVADCGPGIAAEDRAAALSRFGRLDPARSEPGAGLGLALADAVARLHGGRVELADHEPGLISRIVIPTGTLDSVQRGA